MARDYARVAPAFWTGPTGRELRAAGRDSQLMALYLMTSPHANMIGLYQVALPTICHEAGFTIEGASKALRSLSDSGFAFYDEVAEEVWVPSMARFQVLDNPEAMEPLKPTDKRCKGVARELSKFVKSRFFWEFVRRYFAVFHLPFQAPPEDHERSSEGPSKAQRSQEQEQEQEHDQEQEAAAAARVRAKRRSKSGAARPPVVPSTAPAEPSADTSGAPVAPAESLDAGKEPQPETVQAAPPATRQPVTPEAGTDAPPTEAVPGSPGPAAPAEGGAAPAGSAGGQGPRGPARRGPVVDEIPHPPLVLIDLADGGLGPLGAEFKRLAEEGFKRGPLRWAAADKRATVATELERLIGDEQRLPRLVEIWVADATARDVARVPPTASMTGVLLDLQRLAPLLAADPLAEMRERCPKWVRALEEMRKLPFHVSGLQPGQWESLLATLQPELAGDQLTLTAPSEWHREAVRDCFWSLINEAVERFIGRGVKVNLVAPAAQEASEG